jgi:hypothetical protein
LFVTPSRGCWGVNPKLEAKIFSALTFFESSRSNLDYDSFNNRDSFGYYSFVNEPMTNVPTMEELTDALKAAGAAHHEYEQTVLKGVRHEEWALFYAAYVLGRLGDFAPPGITTKWLTEAPLTENWAESAAAYVLSEMRRTRPAGP